MATKQARWGISFQNIFSLAKPICNNCFSNSFYFLINKIIWLFSRFLCCFVVFMYSFSRSFVSFLVIHSCVFSSFQTAYCQSFMFPKMDWTNSIPFFYFHLSKKNFNMFTRLVGHQPRIMFCAWLSSHLLFCYASSYSIHVQSFLFH